jgi:tRNA(adenine34) deaminase
VIADHAHYMRMALDQARHAGAAGDIPIGAVVVNASGDVIATGFNSREVDNDPTAHAEVLALRAAGNALNSWRLTDCTIYVTLEPCPMCAGAIAMSRVSRLVLGAWNDEYGATGSRWDLVRDQRLNHQVEVIPGVLEQECATVVRDFLAHKRK